MSAPLLCVVPGHWRSLIDALVARLGERVYSLVGGTPSYNLYDSALKTQRELEGVNALLLPGLGAGTIDLLKTVRAVGDSALLPYIERLPQQTMLACFLLRLLARQHAQTPFGAILTTSTADLSGQVLVAFGRETSVPVIHLNHGSLVTLPEESWFCAQSPGDLVLVAGERDRLWWRQCAPQVKVVITGNPLWDSYAGQSRRAHDGLTVLWAAESGANPAQTPGYYASRDVPREAWLTFLQAIRGSSEVRRVIIKYREGEEAEFIEQCHRDMVKAWPTSVDFAVAVNDRPASDILPEADVVICQDSNIGVEALHLGIPVVSITRPGSTLFERDGGVTILDATKPFFDADLAETIEMGFRRSHDDPYCTTLKEEAAYYNCGVDGLASQRVINEVAKVLERL